MEQRKEHILIDILQHQVPCSKETARKILKKNQYHLSAALKELKDQLIIKEKYVEEVIEVSGSQLLEVVKNLLRRSNLIQLTISKNEKVLVSLPITISAIIFYLYPLLTSLSLSLFLNKKFTIKILKISGE